MDKSTFFYYNKLISDLKKIKRVGWLRSDVDEAESVAEHIFHVSTITILFIPYISTEIDISKILILSLIHDLPEAVYGDIPSPQKTSKDKDKEKIWLEMFLSDNGYSKEWADELFKLDSLEAKIVKISDLYATILQGFRYIEEYGCEEYIMKIISNCLEEAEKLINLINDNKFKEFVDDILIKMKSIYSRCG